MLARVLMQRLYHWTFRIRELVRTGEAFLKVQVAVRFESRLHEVKTAQKTQDRRSHDTRSHQHEAYRERIAKRQKVTYSDKLANLPVGTFVTFDDPGQSYLVLEDALLAWHPEGYGSRLARANDRTVIVLTPRSVMRSLAGGFRPKIHPSAAKNLTTR